MTVPQDVSATPRTARHATTNALLARASVTSDSQQRHRAISEAVILNMPVARSVASRYRGRGVPIEDLEQVAYGALTRAAQHFDPTQARDFLTYAVPSIRGELKKYFRDLAWAVRPPRRVQEIQTRVLNTERQLGGRLGRRPTAHEIADALGEPVDDVKEALVCRGCFTPTSLDAPVGEHASHALSDLLVDDRTDRELSRIESRLVLSDVLRRLRPRDRQVLHLRFFDDRTQEEIGNALGITQTQVSRTLTRILGELRQAIEVSRPELRSA